MPFQLAQIDCKFRIYVNKEKFYLLPLFYDGKFWMVATDIIWVSDYSKETLAQQLALALKGSFFPAFLDKGVTFKELENKALKYLAVTVYHSGMATINLFKKTGDKKRDFFREEKELARDINKVKETELTEILFSLIKNN